jgi:hypothetical protein
MPATRTCRFGWIGCPVWMAKEQRHVRGTSHAFAVGVGTTLAWMAKEQRHVRGTSHAFAVGVGTTLALHTSRESMAPGTRRPLS